MTNNLPDPLAALGVKRVDRRRFFGLAGLGAGALTLAACGGPSTEEPSNAAGSQASSAGSPAATGSGQVSGSAGTGAGEWEGVEPAKKITFWTNHPGGSQEVEKELIAAFTKETGIEVDHVTAGANYEEVAQKFQTAQTGGTLPDVVIFSDVWWFRYYMQKTILPLDSVLEAVELDTAAYRDKLLSDYQYAGAQWAIPYARSTPLFYYNKDHWKAAGLEDRAPSTWAEFAEWAPKIKAAVPDLQNVYQHPALAGYAGWSFQNILWGYGGGWSSEWEITCDSPESVAALQFLQDSVYADNWAGVSSQEATDDLAAGAVSATVGSTGSLVGVLEASKGKFEVGVGFLPGGPEAETNVCPTGGAGLGIPIDIAKENQLAAAMFLKYLTNAGNTVKFAAATGYMPVQTDADVSELIKVNPLAQKAIDQLEVTHVQDNARAFIPGADQEMAKSCAAILTQRASVQETMTALKDTLTTMFQREVEPNL